MSTFAYMCECPHDCGERIVLTHEEYLRLARIGVVVHPSCALGDVRPAIFTLNGARVLHTSRSAQQPTGNGLA